MHILFDWLPEVQSAGGGCVSKWKLGPLGLQEEDNCQEHFFCFKSTHITLKTVFARLPSASLLLYVVYVGDGNLCPIYSPPHLLVTQFIMAIIPHSFFLSVETPLVSIFL